ncbi:MAG: hypothetical protein ACK5NN_12240 [Sphingomonadaceae bacterium]
MKFDIGDGILFGIGVLAFIFFYFWAPVPGGIAFFSLPVAAGLYDAIRHRKIRWVRSWAPALLGTMIPLVAMLFYDYFTMPKNTDSGMAAGLAMVFTITGAAAFVFITLVVSAVARIIVNATRKAG